MNLIAPPFSWKWSSCTQHASQKHWRRCSVFMIAGLICVFSPGKEKKKTPGDKCQVMKVSKSLTGYILFFKFK